MIYKFKPIKANLTFIDNRLGALYMSDRDSQRLHKLSSFIPFTIPILITPIYSKYSKKKLPKRNQDKRS